MRPTRRDVAAGLTALGAVLAGAAGEPPLAAIERRHGGRLGVFALDAGSGRTLAWRADERFLMCSTFKTLAVARVLSRVETGEERLDRPIAYGEKDLLDYAPVTRAHVAEGSLTVRALCAAAIEVSDNTAANLLMRSYGGPAAVTAYARALGDATTRLDRWEPEANVPDGERDTTSPRAMAHDVRALLLGQALKPASRALLEGWLAASAPGRQRLRAGLPAGWRAAAKAGTGRAQTNDVVLIRPPGHSPLITAAYYQRPAGMAETEADGVLREAGALIAAWA